ncbi:ferrous-iron efflux pump FieF [Rubritalea halochordaticola]|uniref:Ferrous-iron efflux pump FieF n=1 Tax=Rubritalea halochordaticola TaxID=714537 RepID=A0ABP9UZ73_9BACT
MSELHEKKQKADQSYVMAWSLWVGVFLMLVKLVAAYLTGSAAIYGDAAESVVHVVAVAFAAYSVRLAWKPADDTHHYGHDKVSFLSSGFEGGMISVASMFVVFEAVRRWIEGVPVHRVSEGLILTGFAALVNLVLGLWLIRKGKKMKSQILRANGLHVLADVWTSAGAVVGLLLVQATGDRMWDSLAALVVGGLVFKSGIVLVKESLGGLMDTVDPEMDKRVREELERECQERGLTYHNLRLRHSGRIYWVEFHLVVDDGLSVKIAHEIASEVEAAVAKILEPDGRVISHIEPFSEEDRERSWER